uniref:Uncharacterized protein n=1 Tax=viral metagenome TaxID=1070528 RepID=A0A6C0HW82_9ZZZZ
MSFMSNYPIIITLPTGETINCKEVPVATTSYSKLVKSDESVAVLYTPYGWSTMICTKDCCKIKQMYNYNLKTQLVFDSKIVLAVLSSGNHANKKYNYNINDYMDYIFKLTKELHPTNQTRFKEFVPYLQVEFVPKNTIFHIGNKGYDSTEYIEIYNPLEYWATS